MGRYQLVSSCVVIVALFAAALMGGCGEKPQAREAGEVMPTPGPTESGEAPPAEGEAAAADIPESAEKLGDVMGSFTMPSSFVMTVKESEAEAAGEAGQTMTFKMDGARAARMRMQEESAEGTEVMILDFENGVMLSYNTGSGHGFKFPIGEEEVEEVPAPWEDYDPEHKVLGGETIDGVDCWIVEVTSDEGPGKMWIGKQDGLMRKAEAPDGMAVFTITEVDSVPDSAFEVPEGIELSDMSDLSDIPEVEGGGE